MRKIIYFLVLIVMIFTGCETPMDIELEELEKIDGAGFNHELLVDEDGFSPGYYNGKIRTSKIELSWERIDDSDFIGYQIMRKMVSEEEYSDIVFFNDNNHTCWIDEDVTENTLYDYQLVAYSQNGMSDLDQIELKTPQWESPDNLTANGLDSINVMLKWDDNTDSESGFMVYFYEYIYENMEWSWVLSDSHTVSVDVNEFGHGQLNPDGRYSFKVKAFNEWEEDTEFSTTESFYMDSFTLDPPSNIQLQVNSNKEIEVVWQDNSTYETGFIIRRRINQGISFVIDQVEMNCEFFCDADTMMWTVGDSVYYSVEAYNDYGEQEFSGQSDEQMIMILGDNVINIELTVDYNYWQSSWNLYSYSSNEYYYPIDQYFYTSYQTVCEQLVLPPGDYTLECYDSNYNGGISGIIWYQGEVIVTWNDNDYNSYGNFDFTIE